jgi:aryl-alcohol dehydrogenase-like predicted oxidoreductase
MRTVRLGNTGIETSYLSIGTGTNGWNGNSNQTRLGFQECVGLLCHAYDKGIRWIDSADMYGSHRHVAAAVRQIGRDNLVLTTKTVARDAKTAQNDIPRFLKELGADHLDIVLLHCMTQATWPRAMRPVMDVLSRYKDAGVIRAVGCSNHDFGAFCAAAEQEWVDVVLARINFSGVAMDEHPRHVVPVLEKMHAAGKGVYGMKVVGQKRLAGEWQHALKYVFDLRCVDAITVGMESRDEVDMTVGYLESLWQDVPSPMAQTKPESRPVP